MCRQVRSIAGRKLKVMISTASSMMIDIQLVLSSDAGIIVKFLELQINSG